MSCGLVSCAFATSTSTPYRGIGHAQSACSLVSPSTPSTSAMPVRPVTSKSHPILVQADIFGEEELEVISHPAPSEATPSAGALYLLRPVHSPPLSEAKDVDSLMREICSALLFFNRRAP